MSTMEQCISIFIFCLAKYLKIPLRYYFLEIASKIKIKILTPLYLLYLSLLYLRYSPTLEDWLCMAHAAWAIQFARQHLRQKI